GGGALVRGSALPTSRVGRPGSGSGPARRRPLPAREARRDGPGPQDPAAPRGWHLAAARRQDPAARALGPPPQGSTAPRRHGSGAQGWWGALGRRVASGSRPSDAGHERGRAGGGGGGAGAR